KQAYSNAIIADSLWSLCSTQSAATTSNNSDILRKAAGKCLDALLRKCNVADDKNICSEDLFRASARSWHPAGRLLAIGVDNCIKLCNFATGKIVANIPVGYSARAIVWSPNGLYLVSSSGEGLFIYKCELVKDGVAILSESAGKFVPGKNIRH